MTTEVTREELDSLDARVTRIEKLIYPPDGGTPEIYLLLQQLDERISSLQSEAATKKDVDELKRIVAEFRKNTKVQTIQILQPSN
ncbi:MAG: hypothetical protein OEZ01_16940 [Candidatus Heimdallarchaeota archaeon]|nr:hypothetical protein [Candidatus Heimdallarchaeota archaeon]